MARIEVFTGVEGRRRRWSIGEKRAIVEAAFAPGAVVMDVARRANVNTGQIYRWRNEFRNDLAGTSGVSPRFAQVIVSPASPAISSPPVGMIEITVVGGSQVRLPSLVSPELASAIVQALVRS